MRRRRSASIAIAALLFTGVGAAPPASERAHAAPASNTARCKLPAATDDLGSGFPVDNQALPAVGKLKSAMLFVDFEDHPATRGSLLKAESNLRSGVEYLENVSGGKLDVEVTSSDRWVRMPEPSTSYPFERGLSYEDHVRYIEDAIEAADADFDFSDTDVVWVVATEQAKNITYSPTTNHLDVTVDEHHITHAITFGYDQWRWGGLVLAHESGHSLGLPDLYLFEAPTDDPGNWHAAVGGWDLMGLISGQAPEYFAWHRWQLGWLGDRQVACAPLDSSTTTTTTTTIVPVEKSTTGKPSGHAMVVLPVSETKAVVVENRQAIRYDREILTSGALVYTVDTSVRTGHGPIRVVDATPESAHRLDDAPFQPGTSWTEPSTGAVLSFEEARAGSLRVTVEPAA
ncbi:M6 family metalloprotease domain-containing protein [Streptomyces sp. NPDC000151]|uniref:M6 family metalloprotease domain-containing protein n=1 Tax=Streptomyces sp. NPDC000151 TaxID=3154244 RepID=UPI0033188CB9